MSKTCPGARLYDWHKTLDPLPYKLMPYKKAPTLTVGAPLLVMKQGLTMALHKLKCETIKKAPPFKGGHASLLVIVSNCPPLKVGNWLSFTNDVKLVIQVIRHRLLQHLRHRYLIS